MNAPRLPHVLDQVRVKHREELEVLRLQIARLRADLAAAEYDKAMLLADCERLRRELDEEQGVIR